MRNLFELLDTLKCTLKERKLLVMKLHEIRSNRLFEETNELINKITKNENKLTQTPCEPCDH